MQENEFEKQVQQKMDDLKLHPSEAVWQKIEVHIKKEKRRRWVLFLLPVLLIGFLYGGYVLFNNNDPEQQLEQQSTKDPIEKKQPRKASSPDPAPANNNVTIEDDKDIIEQAATTTSSGTQRITTRPKTKITIDHTYAENLEKESSPAFKNESPTSDIVQQEKKDIGIQDPLPDKTAVDQNAQDSTISQVEKPSTQVITEPVKDEKDKLEIIADSSASKIKSSKKYSWKWGLSFAGGVSSMANSFFGYGQQRFDLSAYSNSSPGPPPATGSNPFYASLIKPSSAFIIGVAAERNISNKIIFTTGLTYKLYSTTNNVGTDTAGYYRSNSVSKNYHNYYHYVELPVGLKFQIADLKRTRLYWNTGFSISQLISSNALQYNMSTRFYYHDNSLFNKTQLGFNTGLEIALITKQNQSLLIGPYFNYGISKIAREGYNKHHFTFIGLRAQYLFRK